MNFILDFRERASGGAVVPGFFDLDLTGASDIEDAYGQLRVKDRVIFLLHGFNVNRKDGKEKLRKLITMLPSAQDSSFVITLWPGDHWTGPLSYPMELKDVLDTSEHFYRFINDNLRIDQSICFVTHSLGAHVAMATLAKLRNKGMSADLLCLMAAAIDDDSLSDTEQFRSIIEEASRVFVLHSKKDRVLKYAYPAGDLLHAIFFENQYWRQALGYHGPKKDRNLNQPVPANVYSFPIPKERNAGHGDYLPENKPNKETNAEQISAANFADQIFAGEVQPKYI